MADNFAAIANGIASLALACAVITFLVIIVKRHRRDNDDGLS